MLKKYKNLSIMAKASFWAFVANIIQRGISILATPVFTRILTTEEYAQYTLYQSWHDIFIIFTSLNVFNYAAYTAMIKFEDDKDGFISSAQTLTTGLTLICFGIYSLSHVFCGDILGFSLPVVILMFLDMLFFAVFNLWTAKQRFEYKYRIMTALSVFIGIIGPVLGVFLIYNMNTDKGYGRIYGVAIVNIAVGLIVYIYNIKKSHNMFCMKYWKFILAYCIPLIPHFLSSQILTRFDRIMINDMCSTSEAGIYSLAYSLSTLMTIVNDAILKSFTPWTYQVIKSGDKKEIKKTTNFTILIVALANIILILFAPEAVRIFATNEYYQAIYIIPSVSASVFFTYLFNVFANIEYYYSETKYVAASSVFAALLNVLLNYIFIKKFGFIAAGYTTLVCYIVYALGHFICMNIVSRKHAAGYKFYDNKTILLMSVIFVVISLGILPLYKCTIIRYVIILVLMVLVFVKRNSIKNIIVINKSK